MTSTPPSPSNAEASGEGSRTAEVRAVAADLFLRSGYSGTTMNDIAETAGILPGSLYHHFASKEDIAVELVTAFNEELSSLTVDFQGRTTTGPSDSGLLELMSRSAEISMRHGAAVRILAYEAPSTATERLTAAIDFTDPVLHDVWRTQIKAAVGSASPPVDVDLLRFTLAYLVLNSGLSYPRGTDIQEIVTILGDLLLHGLPAAPIDHDALDQSASMKVAVDAVANWSAAATAPRDDRDEIIAAAKSEFARRGYSATTIRDIAEAAGVRMGTMYRRVSSKEAMFSAIMSNYSEVLNDAVEAVVSADSTPVETLDALAYLLIHRTQHFPDESAIVKFGWTGRETDSHLFRDYAANSKRRLVLLEDLIGRGISDQSIRPIDSSAILAPLIRRILWCPFQDFDDTDSVRAHRFIRRSLLARTLP